MFNKIRFAEIIKKISDIYDNQRDFSAFSGINRTYLSQYMNMKLDEPPKPKTLQKLADASKGITTYTELMIVCGYLEGEIEKYADLSKQLAESKAYIDCYNLLSSTVLSEEEINKLLQIVSTMNIEEGKDEENLKETITALFQSFPEDHKDLIEIVITKYWGNVLKYREEAVKFLKNNTRDEQDFHYAYHKEMEGLTEEEIADALRFYKEMKKRVEKDNR